MFSRKWYFTLMCIVCAVMAVSANVSVTGLFSSNMVLQRNITAPIWGKASAGEEVTVSFNGQIKSTTTGSNGVWRVKLDPMIEGGPYSLTIKGNNTITLSNVYVGEVWQVAGQSNMDTRLSFYTNLADTIKNANVPLLRYCTMRQPGQSTGGQNPWLVVSPSTAPNLSATGYFFGKEIQKTTGVAVGIIITAVGGTTITQWMDPATLAANPDITNTDRGGCWKSWVEPVVGFGIKGTVWIQGEQNCNKGDSPLYGDRFKLVIKGWRDAWGQGDFPFYFGQLSGTSGTPGPNDVSYVAQVREGQRLALELPNTAMTVNCDYAAGDWHYPNKPEAGRRLALPAKALLYGQNTLVYSGPLYSHEVTDGNKIKLIFRNTGGDLTVQGNSLTGFAIASASGEYVWGNATISGDTVIVSSPSVTNPTRVRYGWSNKPKLTLFNKEGLPASPFTTEGEQIPVTFTLTTSISAGEGTVTPSGGNFPSGQTVSLSATAATGYMFDHWEGDFSGKSNPATITMSEDRSVSAFFITDNRTHFTVKTQVSGGGSVIQLPQGTNLVEGTQVSFTAVPNKGWQFTGWSGDHSGTDTVYTISTLDKNTDLTARFLPEIPNLYEAEYGVMKGSVEESENTGFSGNGYVNVDNEIGSSIEITVYVEHEGEKKVVITYANGSAASRSFSISVNGTETISSQTFESTVDWTTWEKKEITLTMQQGINSITFTSNNADGGPNIDKLELKDKTSISPHIIVSMHPVIRYRSGKLDIISTRFASNIRVEMFSLDGQKVLDKAVKTSADSKTSIPIRNLKSGNYIMRINVDNSCFINSFSFLH